MLDPAFVTGAPNWVDLGTPDIDAATAFYHGLFGWELVPGGPETGGYGTYRLRERTVAGVMTVPEEQGKPAWSVYFQTPTPTPPRGRSSRPAAVRCSPRWTYSTTGAWAASRTVPARTSASGSRGRTPASASPWSRALIWSELHTPDVPSAAAFFHTVFGWQTEAMAYPSGSYTMVRPAGGEGAESSFGGIVPLDEAPGQEPAGPHWLPYFAVDDADATAAGAERLGGRVVVAATDVPEVGRIATLTDPAGAAFAVIKPAPM